MLNPFQANVPILYSLETSENQRFFEVFGGDRKGTLARNGLRKHRILAENMLMTCLHYMSKF